MVPFEFGFQVFVISCFSVAIFCVSFAHLWRGARPFFATLAAFGVVCGTFGLAYLLLFPVLDGAALPNSTIRVGVFVHDTPLHLHDTAFAYVDGRNVTLTSPGVRLYHLAELVNGSMTEGCFAGYCNEGKEVLKMYVNGKISSPEHLLGDNDSVLISFGDESKRELQLQYLSLR